MSEIAQNLRLRRSESVALNADVVALAGLSILCVALAALTWKAWGDLGQDTGYDILAGIRTAHGQLPYVDYAYYYGPLGPAVLGLAALIGGNGLAPALTVGIVLAGGIVFATYGVARLAVGATGAFLAAAITAGLAFSPTNMSYVLPHTLSAPLAILATLAFIAAAASFSASGHLQWALAAGCAIGLVGLTRPEFELAVVLAAAAWLFIRSRERGFSATELLTVAAPAAAIPVAVYGAFLAAGVSLHGLLFENLYPTRVLHAGGNALLRSQAPLTISSFATLAGRTLLYALGVAALTALALTTERRLGKALAALVIATAIAVAVIDPEAIRTKLETVYGWLPLGAAIAAVALVTMLLRRGSGSSSQQATVLLLSTVVLAVLAAKTYDGFFFHAPHVQPAVYAAPFAAIFLVNLHLRFVPRGHRTIAIAGATWLAFLAAVGIGLTIKDAHAKTATVSGPGGSLAASPADAAVLNPALSAIGRYTRPGDAILVAPQLTSLYVLADRRDPLPQLSLLPGALTTDRWRTRGDRAPRTRPRSAGRHRPAAPDRVPPRRLRLDIRQSTDGLDLGALRARIDAWPGGRRRRPHTRHLGEEAVGMKVGITGVAGFLGSHLCDRLLRDGIEVVGVDDLSRGTMVNLSGAVQAPGFRFERLDCTRRHDLRAAFDGCDAIVHLAAQKIPRYGGALMTLEANVAGVNAAAHAALAMKADLVVASTSDVYGNGDPPFAEDDKLVLGPPTTRRWAYAVSKLYDEHVCLALAEERDLKVTILRFFGSYGPRNHPSWWGGPQAAFFEALLDGETLEIHGDGQQTRTFTYVDDTVDGIYRSILTPAARGEVVNIGANSPTTIYDLAVLVQTTLGMPMPLRARIVPYHELPGRYQDVRHRVPDTTKARRLLGFEAKTDLAEGLAKTAEWHQARRLEEAVEA